MIKTLNPSLTSIEKKYLVLSDFWCRMNNIRVKSVECIPLEDGSCDSKLIDRCDLKNRIIYVKDYEESVMSMVNMIIKFIYHDLKIETTENHFVSSGICAKNYIYDNETLGEIKEYKDFTVYEMEKIFDFLTWLKEKAVLQP